MAGADVVGAGSGGAVVVWVGAGVAVGPMVAALLLVARGVVDGLADGERLGVSPAGAWLNTGDGEGE